MSPGHANRPLALGALEAYPVSVNEKAQDRFLTRRVDSTVEKGAVLVEFILVVPILVMLVFGIINFGIVFGQVLSLNNSARDAARFAVVRQIDNSPGRSCEDTLDRARAAATGPGLAPNQIGVTVWLGGTEVCSIAAKTSVVSGTPTQAPCEGSVSGKNDRLRVQTSFQSILAVPVPGAKSFNLTGNGYFRCEYS